MDAIKDFEIPLQVVLDTVLDGIIAIDDRGTILKFNKSAMRIFGYETDEVIGNNIKMLMPEPYHSEHDGYLNHYVATGEKKIIGIGREVSGLRKNGSVFPIDLGVNELKVGNQRFFVGIIRDISHRKESENTIRNEATRLSAIMDTVLDGLITINSKGIIQSFNASACRIFGYEPQDVIGSNVNVLMPEPYYSEHDGYLKQYLDTGERKVIGIGREVIGRRKNGTTFPMGLGVNEMRIGNERMFVGTIRDITERKIGEAAIMKYLQKLKRSNQELDDFAYIASHDLKEPIRGLSNNALFLLEDYSDSLDNAGQKRLNRMVFLCKRMEQLVDDLLYFSRLGRQELAVQEVDLNQIISDIAVLLESALLEQHARIVIPKPLPTIKCDVPRITEVFRNLISNAIKYNNNDEKIVEIGVVDNEQRSALVYYVKDNGIGIDSRFHQDVFRIFKRLNEEDDTVKGTGVGLTFVKKIIERHGGSIWLESEAGKGTTFFFTLTSEHGD